MGQVTRVRSCNGHISRVSEGDGEGSRARCCGVKRVARGGIGNSGGTFCKAESDRSTGSGGRGYNRGALDFSSRSNFIRNAVQVSTGR